MNGRALVAWNLRRLRMDRGVSQEVLAADARLNRPYIGQLEREEANVSVDTLDVIAAYLGVSIADFFIAPPEGAVRSKGLRAGRRPKA
jgi:transcriptional regulator with XRE-family HTH domain